MRRFPIVSTALVTFVPVFGAAMAQDSSTPPPGAVTVVIADDGYPAFNPPPLAPNGRPTITPRAIVFWSAPWSQDSPAILLNPAHANAETFYIALLAII